MTGGLQVEIALVSHRGTVRSENEDSAGVAGWVLSASAGEPLVLRRAITGFADVVVADGLGGHQGGARASRQAVAGYFGSTATDPVAAVMDADGAVHALAEAEPALRGMGTTIVVARVDADGRLTVVNVGDSRAYRLVDGFLGRLSDDDRPDGDASGIVTQVLGGARRVAIDPHVFTAQLNPGDVVLLCSDGLHDVVDEPDVAEALRLPVGDAAPRLVELALAAGAPDNVTVAVLAVVP